MYTYKLKYLYIFYMDLYVNISGKDWTWSSVDHWFIWNVITLLICLTLWLEHKWQYSWNVQCEIQFSFSVHKLLKENLICNTVKPKIYDNLNHFYYHFRYHYLKKIYIYILRCHSHACWLSQWGLGNYKMVQS